MGTGLSPFQSEGMRAPGKCDHVSGSGWKLMVCVCVRVLACICMSVAEVTQPCSPLWDEREHMIRGQREKAKEANNIRLSQK